MKFLNLTLALGLAVVGLAVAPVRAALTYNPGDLLLGFYAQSGQGASESVVVNLGPASQFRDFTGTSFDLTSVGSIKMDLVATYGADWSTRSDLKWGVFGTTYDATVGSDPAYTLYATKPEGTIGVVANAYNRGSQATQSQPSTRIKDVADLFAGGTAGNNPRATVQSSSMPNDFGEFQTNNGNLSFGYFNVAMGNFGNGPAGTALDLFRMQTGSSSSKGTYEGTFTIDDAGMIHFTAVPEPSVFALLSFAAAGIFLGRILVRRQTHAALGVAGNEGLRF